MPEMRRIQRIIENETFGECLGKTEQWEQEREFCRHDTNHFLHVARIAMILNLQEGMQIDRELIYASALLHDIGTFEQYESGTDHAMASARIAPGILHESGFSDKEIGIVTEAIRNHRNIMIRDDESLAGLLFRADKLSRDCYFCKMNQKCDWKAEKKNQQINI